MANSRNAVSGAERAHTHPHAHFVEQFIERNGVELMRVARRYCANAADAEDVYQRAMEMLLTKAPDGDEQRLLAWTQTVIRNEARSEWRKGAKRAVLSYEDYAEGLSTGIDETHERIVDVERFGQGREALKRIKVDQLRCLLLRADGLDYDEICDLTGFSYAKVNRCLSEGRKAFRDRVERIESGAECRRLEGVLSMMADGQASSTARTDAETHLRNCANCQTTLREFMGAPDRAAVLVPIGFLGFEAIVEASGPARGPFAKLGDSFDSVSTWLQERFFAQLTMTQPGGEIVLAKKATIAALSVSLVAGGVAANKVIDHGGDRPQAELGGAVQGPVIQSAPAASSGRRSGESAAKRRATARKAKRAREAEVLGSSAGAQVEPEVTQAPGSEGSSANDGTEFEPPAASSPADTGPGSSVEQLPDIAP